MLFLKITCAFKMFWFGFGHSDFLTEQTLTVMARLFDHIMKTVNDDKPYCTHLYISEHRIASLWSYPGLSKNPIDRITELLSEITALKEAAQLRSTEQGAPFVKENMQS
jgi:hypothetical protein